MADGIFRNRRRGRAFWLLLPLLLSLYLVLFPRPGGKETLIRPIWVKELSSTATSPSNGGDLWYFRAEDRFGYADLEGNLYFVGRTLHNLSLSDSGFMNYGSVPDHVVFMNPRGEFELSIKIFGYPLLESGGRALYSINTDRGGLKRIDTDGQVLWSKSFPTLITTIALSREYCLLGLMDGRALLIGSEGEVIYRHTGEEARIPIVLAAAVSGDLNQLALVSGIDPQTLAVVERRAGQYLPYSVQTLDSDFRRELHLNFSEDGKFLFYEVEGGLAVLEVRKKTARRFLEEGVLESLDSSPEFSAAAFRIPGGSKLLLFRPLDSVLLSRETAAERLYVKVIGGSLILGLNGAVLRADLLEG